MLLTVIVLYNVDKAAENIQHLIKWIMDCYSDACKLILCCEDDVSILDSVKSRCKVVELAAPVTHEVSLTIVLSNTIYINIDYKCNMSFGKCVSFWAIISSTRHENSF